MIDVLIVEDDKDMAKLLRVYLEIKGYKCSIAFTVEEAIYKLRNVPNACVIDLMLPDAPGDNLIPILKERLPDCLPIVWTALPSGDRTDKIKKQGTSVVLKNGEAGIRGLMALLPPPRPQTVPMPLPG